MDNTNQRVRSIVHRAIHRDTGEPAMDGKKETPIYSNKLIRKAHYMIQCYLQVFANETFNSAVVSKQPCTSHLWCFCILSIFKREWRRFKTAAIFQSIMLCLYPLPNDLNKSTFSWKDVQHWANDESVSSFKATEFCHFHLRWSVGQFLITWA